MRRRVGRRDPTQAPICAALIAIGCDVLDLSQCGIPGVPDLLVRRGSFWTFIEAKSPKGPRGGTSAKGQKLNDAQEAFALRWPVCVARTPDEAIALVNDFSIRGRTA